MDSRTAVRVAAPYSPAGMTYHICSRSDFPIPESWPAIHGTWVKTPLPRSVFNTLKSRNATDQERMGYLAEALRVTYASILNNVEMVLEWTLLGENKQSLTLMPLAPDWEKSVTDTKEVDLGGGLVKVSYTYGRIKARPSALKFYKGNITSSGLEICMNGRLMESNIFEEVWNQPHPSYNNFLFQLNLIPVDADGSDGRDALPLPTPEKDKMLRGDPKLDALFDWVRRTCPDPKKEIQLPKGSREVDECRKLADDLMSSGLADKVELEMSATLGGDSRATRTDIFLNMKDGRTILMETKLKGTKVQDMAQLASYGFLAALDGLVVDELILVASKHSRAVNYYANELQGHWFNGLKAPAISCRTWDEIRALSF